MKRWKKKHGKFMRLIRINKYLSQLVGNRDYSYGRMWIPGIGWYRWSQKKEVIFCIDIKE